MMRLILLLLLCWSTSSWAMFQCKDADGVITFRDTPCPTLPNSTLDETRARYKVSAESARLAIQLRIGMQIEQAIKLLGSPVEQASNGDNAWYLFRTSVADGLGTYEAEMYTLDGKVTSLSDDYRRLWARGKIWRGVTYEKVLWTWGAPKEQTEETTEEGLKRTLVYDSNAKGGTLDTVYLIDDKVTDIEYGNRSL